MLSRLNVTFFALFLLVLGVSACTTNPVTGKQMLAIVPEGILNNQAAKQYAPLQQAQGAKLVSWPKVEAYVNDIGQKLAKVSDRPELEYEFVVLNQSVPNAWALPGGKIAINRGLLVELGDEAELAAVLAHEIVHAAAQHGQEAMSHNILVQGIALASTIAVGTRKGATQGHVQMAQIGTAVGGKLYMSHNSRTNELEADEYGMKYMVAAGYDPQAAVDLQRTFVRLSEGQQSDWLSAFFASHPPSQQRVLANQQHALSLGSKGQRFANRYQKIIGPLKKVLPAYKAYDEASLALKEKDYATAHKKLDLAIAQYDKEAMFYGLKAQAYFLQDKKSSASTWLAKARARHEGYFAIEELSGRLAYHKGNMNQAKQAFSTAQTLLPTPISHYYLGLIAYDAGSLKSAYNHLARAVNLPGEQGERAKALVAVIQNQLPQAKPAQNAR